MSRLTEILKGRHGLLVLFASGFLFAMNTCTSRYPEMNLSFLALLGQDARPDVVIAGGNRTTEAGGVVVLTFRLASAPLSPVTMRLEVSDPNEATLDKTVLVFTRTDWNVDQRVRLTGRDDYAADGNRSFTVRILPLESSDPAFNGVDPPDLDFTNDDDETPGFVITTGAVLQTTETGGTATFQVRLKTAPTANVTIPSITSTDLTEGTVSPASLTFTPANWYADQTVTVTGVDDGIPDGTVAFQIMLAPAASADSAYSGLDPADVGVQNTDNETPGITVTPTSGLVTTEAGGTAVFNISLNTVPAANVNIAVSTSNASEGTASTALVVLNGGTMNQNVTITGVDDAVKDGNVAYAIVLAAATSGDPAYNGINPPDVSVTNNDNEKYTFVTAASYPGTLGGIAGADAKCMADINRPSGTTYKALLVDGGVRIACTSVNCAGGPAEHIDWVLLPNATYFQSNGTTAIFTTNANGIFVFGTLTNSFGTSGQYWSGLNGVWTSAGLDCGGWTTTGPPPNGRVGSATAVNGSSVANGNSNCSSGPQPLLCVEQ